MVYLSKDLCPHETLRIPQPMHTCISSKISGEPQKAQRTMETRKKKISTIERSHPHTRPSELQEFLNKGQATGKAGPVQALETSRMYTTCKRDGQKRERQGNEGKKWREASPQWPPYPARGPPVLTAKPSLEPPQSVVLHRDIMKTPAKKETYLLAKGQANRKESLQDPIYLQYWYQKY